jgi:hypothetical protein
VILDRWRVSSIYRSCRLSRSATESTFSDHGTTILTEYMPGGDHVRCRDEIGGDDHFPRQEGVLGFGYLRKWSPCAYESLSTKGEDYYPYTL